MGAILEPLSCAAIYVGKGGISGIPPSEFRISMHPLRDHCATLGFPDTEKKYREGFAARYVWERDAIFGPVCLVGNVLIALGMMASGQCIPYRLFI